MNNTPSPVSQVETQSIAGQPPVEVRPQGLPKSSGSIAGAKTPVTYDDKKGKGNN